MVSRALVSILVGLNGLFVIGLFKRQIKKTSSRSLKHISPAKITTLITTLFFN